MMKDRRPSLFWTAVIVILLSISFYLISLNVIRGQVSSRQMVLKAPATLFTYWHWPFSGWEFHKINFTLVRRPEVNLPGLKGRIKPKLWNLLMGCSSGSDVSLQRIEAVLPAAGEILEGLRLLVQDLAYSKNTLHKYICQSTVLDAENSSIHFKLPGGKDVLVERFGYKKTDDPVVQWEGILPEGRPFGVNLTYKSNEDIVIFASDFWNQSRFDGQVDSFLDNQKAVLSGELYWPAVAMTLRPGDEQSLSLSGTLSVSAELSGNLNELVTKFWEAETLLLNGAMDARDGVLQPFNLAAVVLSETGQIPALTQLGKLIHEKALPGVFYRDETPFELLRFIIHKEGSMVDLSRVMLKHSSFLAAGEGWVHPSNGLISFKGSLVLSDDLSRSLIKNVPRLEILLSEGGRLSLPFLIEGSLKAPKVHADIAQITEKMIAAYRTELVRRGNSRIQVLQ